MEIMARRLTIISLLMAVFAISLAAAVETDVRRAEANTGTSKMVACASSIACHTAL